MYLELLLRFPSRRCPYQPLWYNQLITDCRTRGLQTDEAQLTKHVTTLSAKLDVYEQILSKQKYLAGDELTLADIFHLPYGTRLYTVGHGDLIDKRPNVKKYAP